MHINTLFKTSNAFYHHWLQDYHLKQGMKWITYKFSTRIYRMIQSFGGRNFWWNSSQQRLVNNILMNAQNQVDITKHSLVTHEMICHCNITCYITCNVSWSPVWSTCLVLRQWFVTIMNISEPVLNFVWPLEFCLLPSSGVEFRSLCTHALA